ncbi:MAG TPA: DUF362 domain-containing protein [Bryobacteraceae bacterium]|nr:DUF362 domain-containing protein [Bryobacteraceae bacterium]
MSILRANAYGPELYDLVRRVVVDHKVNVRGKGVVIKPNLVDYDAERPIYTHPMLVHAALEAFRALGADDVRICEGPANRPLTLDLAEEAGYFSIIPDFERIFVDANTDEVTRVPFVSPHSDFRDIYLPNTALGCDLLVSLPKMKTHRWAGVTLASKNLFGLVPGAVYGWPKNLLHWNGIHATVADLRKVFRKTFAIVDGVDALEGYGPLLGTRVHAGVIVAGADLTAVDATCCRIMGVDPEQIGHLTLAASVGQIDERLIAQAGEAIRSVRRNFQLTAEWTHVRLSV